MLGKTEDRRRRSQQRMRWLDGITDSMNKFEQALGDVKNREAGMGQSMESQSVGHDEQLNNNSFLKCPCN